MKNLIFKFFLLLLLSFQGVFAQDQSKKFRNFPLVLSIQFHSLSTPFKNLKSNFRNLGIGIGTEVSHNGQNNWVQQFNLLWYHNKAIGNGFLLSTQTAWRPYLVSSMYGEMKAGLGYMIAGRPGKSFIQKDGVWASVGRKGKGMLTIPVGLGGGYHSYSSQTFVSPFASYQMMLVKGYNQSVPMVLQSLIQVGSRVHFSKANNSY
jgi:hypothetical protein